MDDMGNIVVRIDDKMILEAYAFHGREGINVLIEMVEEAIFDFIDSQEKEIFSNIKNKLKEKIRNDTTKMEN